MRALNLAPGLGQASGGLQQHKADKKTCQKSAISNQGLKHHSHSGDGLVARQELHSAGLNQDFHFGILTA
jgi:hypothetical protein